MSAVSGPLYTPPLPSWLPPFPGGSELPALSDGVDALLGDDDWLLDGDDALSWSAQQPPPPALLAAAQPLAQPPPTAPWRCLDATHPAACSRRVCTRRAAPRFFIHLPSRGYVR